MEKLYLELSQVCKAKTEKQYALELQIENLRYLLIDVSDKLTAYRYKNTDIDGEISNIENRIIDSLKVLKQSR